jgi:hypothetical protein
VTPPGSRTIGVEADGTGVGDGQRGVVDAGELGQRGREGESDEQEGDRRERGDPEREAVTGGRLVDHRASASCLAPNRRCRIDGSEIVAWISCDSVRSR